MGTRSAPLYIYSPIRRVATSLKFWRCSVPLYIYSPIRPQTRALVSDHCPHPQAAESALSYKIIRIYSSIILALSISATPSISSESVL